MSCHSQQAQQICLLARYTQQQAIAAATLQQLHSLAQQETSALVNNVAELQIALATSHTQPAVDLRVVTDMSELACATSVAGRRKESSSVKKRAANRTKTTPRGAADCACREAGIH
jgi:hypothetical protein